VYTKQSDGPIDQIAACKAMKAEYDAAVLAARKCDPNASPSAGSQCGSTAEQIELGCQNECQFGVQDSTGLGSMSEHFFQAGCSKVQGFGCTMTCPGPQGVCQAQPGGGGLCVPK
jgi:hypothetical protein